MGLSVIQLLHVCIPISASFVKQLNKYAFGFKQGKSTITAGLAIQSLIARALDNDEYFVLGSLDLSVAFDVVVREL